MFCMVSVKRGMNVWVVESSFEVADQKQMSGGNSPASKTYMKSYHRYSWFDNWATDVMGVALWKLA